MSRDLSTKTLTNGLFVLIDVDINTGNCLVLSLQLVLYCILTPWLSNCITPYDFELLMSHYMLYYAGMAMDHVILVLRP